MVHEKQLLAEGWLKCRVLIELVGKPKEHIESTMKKYIEEIKNEKDIRILDEQIADIKKRETGATEQGMMKELWTTFAELEMIVKEPMTLTLFCFNYMPSSVEIIEPEQIKFDNLKFTKFFNDFQARLHQLDMIVKQMKTELIFSRKSINGLLKNYVILLLRKQSLNSKQLSILTGVSEKVLEDFLDTLIDKEDIVLEGDLYKLKKQGEKNEE